MTQLSPKEKAIELFNTIRYMDGESGKGCVTCDCVILPIAKFTVNEIIKQWEYIDTYIADFGGKLNPNLNYWQQQPQV